MTKTVRAIYKDGTLRLLDPVNLDPDQEVQVTVSTAARKRQLETTSFRKLFGSISHEDARAMTIWKESENGNYFHRRRSYGRQIAKRAGSFPGG
jgi:predicted DNA-binding antitoxin AbrB/MazE fold protein